MNVLTALYAAGNDHFDIQSTVIEQCGGDQMRGSVSHAARLVEQASFWMYLDCFEA